MNRRIDPRNAQALVGSRASVCAAMPLQAGPACTQPERLPEAERRPRPADRV